MSNYQSTPPITHGQPDYSTRSNGLAIAGMVCGIVGLLFFNVVLGPLAIIFGSVGLSRAKNGAAHRKMAIAAIVLGIVDLVIFVVLLVAASHNGGTIYFHAG